MSKIKEIFKGNASDADKTAAFTGQEGGGISKDSPDQSGASASGLSSQAQSGENTSAFTGRGQNDVPEGDVKNKSGAPGLGSQANSGENTTAFTGGEA